MKFAPLFGFALNLLIASAQAAPPFYYGKPVTVIDKDSVYYGCSGTVADWAQGGTVVSNLCGEYIQEIFKDEQLRLNSEGAKNELQSLQRTR